MTENAGVAGGADWDGPNLVTTDGGIELTTSTKRQKREEGGGQGKEIGGGASKRGVEMSLPAQKPSYVMVLANFVVSTRVDLLPPIGNKCQ
jgi:hypothetical protein